MTGFGRAEFNTTHGPVRIELKAVNLKFFELNSRHPDDLIPFAESIRKIIQRRVKRGKVMLTIASPDHLVSPGSVLVNEKLAIQYHRALNRLNRTLGLNERVTLAHIVRMPDVMTRVVSRRDVKDIWEKSKTALQKALDAFDQSRLKEGGALSRDMAARATKIAKRIREIERRGPKVVRLYKKKIEKRLGEISGEGSRERLSSEIAAFAKNCDVTEEIVRLHSHIDSFRSTLRHGGEVGRKIDFIAQEMVRETNTIGAKSNDFAIADHVIHVKAELEKIREQAQNVE